MRVAIATGLCVLAVAGCASRPTPIAYHPITIDAHCVQVEEDGFREDARLAVDDNRVRAIDWRLWVGRRGNCRFALNEFRQTRAKPQIELVATDGSGCRLFVWQEPDRVTLAHAGCEARCTNDIYDEAWPVSFDPSSGGCAVIR
ncbi:MAG: hypothetical protein ABI277_02940 [Burkholderiaceae bacterium]